MKSRRLIESKIGISAANDGSFFLRDRSSFLAPFTFVRLEEQNSSHNGSENNDQYNGIYDFNARFNPSMAIIIVVLLAAFFLMGFFSIYLRRCTSDDDGSRYSRRRGRNNNNNNNDGALNRDERHGLDKTVIESFPVFSYSLVKGLKTQTKGSECAVCLSDFQDDEMLRLLPKCGHAFHPECIDMWLCSHRTCPVCRTDLIPDENANPAETDYGVVEPQPRPAPAEQVMIVVDNGESAPISRHGSIHKEATEPSHDSPILGLAKETDEFRRSRSTGHSLVRLRKDLEKCTEWYIATPSGLTPGLHRSCSFVAMHHSRSQGPSSSLKFPKLGGGGGGCDDACTSQGAGRTRSERWGGISAINPSAFIRSFSERRAPVARQLDQRGLGMEVPSSQLQERMAYLKKTFNWLTGRDRERMEGSQGGSRSSRRVDVSGATTSAAAA